jgi:hypothetical protein
MTGIKKLRIGILFQLRAAPQREESLVNGWLTSLTDILFKYI